MFMLAMALMGANVDRPDMRTVMATARPVYSSGALTGCAIEYKAVFDDHTYRQGAETAILGSINLTDSGDAIYHMVKTVLLDINGQTFVPSTPTTVNITDGVGGSTAPFLAKTMPAETPGGILSVFSSDATKLIFEAIRDETITLLINRGGKLDSFAIVDIDVEDTLDGGTQIKNHKARDGFFACVTNLTAKATK